MNAVIVVRASHCGFWNYVARYRRHGRRRPTVPVRTMVERLNDINDRTVTIVVGTACALVVGTLAALVSSL